VNQRIVVSACRYVSSRRLESEERLVVTGVGRRRSRAKPGENEARTSGIWTLPWWSYGQAASLSRRQLARRLVEEGQEGRIEGSDESEARRVVRQHSGDAAVTQPVSVLMRPSSATVET
jgi:hypothetical protein